MEAIAKTRTSISANVDADSWKEFTDICKQNNISASKALDNFIYRVVSGDIESDTLLKRNGNKNAEDFKESKEENLDLRLKLIEARLALLEKNNQ